MPTYCGDATNRFDWLHFLVVADCFRAAKRKVIDAFTDKTYSYIEDVVSSGNTDIIGFSVDKDDLEFGHNSFEVEDYPGTIDVLDDNFNRLEFETLEDAKEYIKDNNTDKYVLTTHRGWTFQYMR